MTMSPQHRRAKVEAALKWVADAEENVRAMDARHALERGYAHAGLERARAALAENLRAAEQEGLTRSR
jgi:hypothetical protein